MKRKNDKGTSTLEVVGMAPLVVLVLLILVQAAMALYGITTAQTAARQGARAYSQGNDPYSVVRKSVPGWMGVDVQTFGPGHGVKATLDLPDILPGYNLKVSRQTVMP
jgi:hypothetical protein